jgi:hypothetical protein
LQWITHDDLPGQYNADRQREQQVGTPQYTHFHSSKFASSENADIGPLGFIVQSLQRVLSERAVTAFAYENPVRTNRMPGQVLHGSSIVLGRRHQI